MESLVCSFYLSVAALKIVRADPSLRYTGMLLGLSATNKQTIPAEHEMPTHLLKQLSFQRASEPHQFLPASFTRVCCFLPYVQWSSSLLFARWRSPHCSVWMSGFFVCWTQSSHVQHFCISSPMVILMSMSLLT